MAESKNEDKHKDVMIPVRMPADMRDKFKAIVERKAQTQSKVIRQLIQRYIDDNE